MLKNILIMLLIIAAVSACTTQEKGPVWKGSITEKDGVTIVHNPKEPMYSENILTLEEELSIGKENGPEEYIFGAPRGVTVDDRGNIFILDAQFIHIKRFDRDGKHIRTFGRKGQGPGEFQAPSYSFILDGQLVIHDIGKRSWEYFDLMGNYIRSFSLKRLGSAYRGEADSRGNIICTSWRADGLNTVVYDSELNELFTLGVTPPDLPLTLTLGKSWFNWKIYQGDHFLCGYSNEYELKIIDPQGKCVQLITKEYKKSFYSDKEIKEKKEALPSDFKVRIASRQKEVFMDLISDEEGRIYVRQELEGPGEELPPLHWDVFDKKGRFLTRTVLPMWIQCIEDEKLYAVEYREKGVLVVKRYQMIWDFNGKR